jgi:hypothetical protein
MRGAILPLPQYTFMACAKLKIIHPQTRITCLLRSVISNFGLPKLHAETELVKPRLWEKNRMTGG